MKLNPIHCTDGYKLGHRHMYAEGTELIYANFTARSDSRFAGSRFYDNKMVVFGIQGFIREFLVETFDANFFGVDKEIAVAKFRRRVDNYLTPGSIASDGIAALHDLGYLPIHIRALPEGSRVPMKVPVLTIHNTHKDFAWIVNYLESVISNSIWKSMVNATMAYEYRRTLEHYADLTGADRGFIDWQCHDFSFRGMSGPEDGARSGAAHMLCFTGTDAVAAIDYVEDYYEADVEKDLVVGSLPATEHSVSSNNILFEELNLPEGTEDAKLVAETVFMKRYIDEIIPAGGMAGYVSDTFDFFGVLTKVLPAVKDKLIAANKKIVIRPDSGDPVKIICGYDQVIDVDTLGGTHLYKMIANSGDQNVCVFNEGRYYAANKRGAGLEYEFTEISEDEVKGALVILYELFGGETNDKGFKNLHPCIGLIYGDSITINRQEAILSRMTEMGFASTNVVFGIGSYTYNYSTRDTFGSAMKATAAIVDGVHIPIYKDPKTGDGMKKSAKGFMRVDIVDGEYVLTDEVEFNEASEGELKMVFEDGQVYVSKFADIRNRLLNGGSK